MGNRTGTGTGKGMNGNVKGYGKGKGKGKYSDYCFHLSQMKVVTKLQHTTARRWKHSRSPHCDRKGKGMSRESSTVRHRLTEKEKEKEKEKGKRKGKGKEKEKESK